MAQLANLGYFGLKKETTKATAVTPDVYVPLYEDAMSVVLNQDEDNPIVGLKLMRHNIYPGMRGHTGTIKIMGEPNTVGYIMDAILTKGSTTGNDPYTHPFTLSNSTDPNSYTFDIARGRMVDRFIGSEISGVQVGFEDNKMVLTLTVSARKNFGIREVASVNTADVTLKTDYDPSPTDGLVASDLIGFYDVSAGTYISNLTVSSIGSGTVFTASGTPAGIEEGDLVFLRPATPSLSILTPFMWSRTEFRFGASAAAALTASQTRVEQGSLWNLLHNFDDNEGPKLSGSFDPGPLRRTQGDLEINISREFDNMEDYNLAMSNASKALVIRHFSGTGYELRITANQLKRIDPQQRPLQTGGIIFDESNYRPTYHTSDGQGFDVKVLNAVATI